MLCLDGLFFRLRLPLFLLFAIAFSGCGDGSSSSSNIPAENASRSSAVPTYKELLQGQLTWDFSIRGPFDQPQVYRSHLAARSIGFVQDGDTLGGNVLAGGFYTDDFYAPAVVTAKQGRISLHSRITGQSRAVINLRKNQSACAIFGFVNEELTSGLINLVLGGSNGECEGTEGDDVSHWVSFDDEQTRSWIAQGFSGEASVVYNDVGEIDVIIATDSQSSSTTLYNRQGQVLSRIVGSTSAPRLFVIGSPGVSRDDSFISLYLDGQLHITTLNSLIGSGVSSPVLTDLSENVAYRSDFRGQNSLLIDRDTGLVYVIDEINRTIEILYDFSAQISDGWTLAEVFFVENRSYALLSFGDSPETAKLEAYTRDFDSGVEQQILAGDFQLYSSTQTFEHVYVTYVSEVPPPDPSDPSTPPEYELKTLIGDADAGIFTPAGSTAFTRAFNYAQGGNDILTIALVAENFSSDRGLENPEVWAVSNLSGQPENRVLTITENCAAVQGNYALANDVSTIKLCSGFPSFNHLNLEYGTLNLVTPFYRPIF